MSVKLSYRDLNPSPYPPHPMSTYTCEITIVKNECGNILYNLSFLINILEKFPRAPIIQ